MDLRNTIERYYREVFNQGRVDVIDELLAPDYVNHSPGSPAQDRGRAGVKSVVAWLRSEFSDLHYAIEDVVLGGDTVAVRTTVTGVQAGRPFSVTQIAIERFREGRIVEHWRVTEPIESAAGGASSAESAGKSAGVGA